MKNAIQSDSVKDVDNQPTGRRTNSKGCQFCTAEENIGRNENHHSGVVGAPGACR